jgi:hypothetical protein
MYAMAVMYVMASNPAAAYSPLAAALTRPFALFNVINQFLQHSTAVCMHSCSHLIVIHVDLSVLYPQEDAQELADPIRLAKLIKQYSQFIQFPIKLYSSRKEAKQVVDEAATAKRQEEADKIAKDKEEEPIKVSCKTAYDSSLVGHLVDLQG